MSFATYKQTTPLQFFDRENLKAERTMLNNYVHDMVKNYGLDVLYVSQKKNFPIVPHADKPTEQDILFHAYGDAIKPEYNEPFVTRLYLKVDNDLFAIDQFGLSNDMSVTLFFSKLDFAFDGAIALADKETIQKTFKFRATINANEPTCGVTYTDQHTKFKLDFPWVATDDKKNVTGNLITFEISPDTTGNSFIYASFTRRYSAKYHVQDSKISVRYNTGNVNAATNTIDIMGTITCSFVVKNPFTSYAEYERKITPAVGDIVFIQTVDDKFAKLEITEVVSENKTMAGINPLLGTYVYQCACKPYIADNATNAGDLDSPTAENINKLEAIDNLSQNASVLGDGISHYAPLYVDSDLGQIYQDDIYGGYDLAEPLSINMSKLPIKTDEGQTLQHYFKWSLYNNIKFNLHIATHDYTYTADELYNQLINLFDSDYTTKLQRTNPLIPIVDYSMCNVDTLSTYVDALNCKFYVAENNYGYLEYDAILNLIKDDTTILTEFIENNPELVSLVNADYVKGFKSPTKLPYLDESVLESYIDVLKDKQPSNLVQVVGNKFTREEAEDAEDVEYVSNGTATIIVDMRNIERRNIGTKAFTDLLEMNANIMSVKPSPIPQIPCHFIKGDLQTVYKFGDRQNTRLATNGLELFVETHDANNLLYRCKFQLNTESYCQPATTYHDKTVSLNADVSWLTADRYGMYFNPIVGDKLWLAGDSTNYDLPTITELSHKCDITSAPDSEIITFAKSAYYIKLVTDASALDAVKPTDKCQLLYVHDMIGD